jgi:hypothetical protein
MRSLGCSAICSSQRVNYTVVASRSKGRMRPYFLYVLKANPGGLIKIGHSFNVEKRLQILRKAYSENLELIRVFSFPDLYSVRKTEIHLHHHFSSKRCKLMPIDLGWLDNTVGYTEWFSLTDEDLDFIDLYVGR